MNLGTKRLLHAIPSVALYTICIGAPLLCLGLLYGYRATLQGLVYNEYQRQAFLLNMSSIFQDFITLTLGILVEALPFVILGVLISIIIQTLIPAEKLIAKLPQNGFLRRAVISCLGILMPVCECGNVPVARSLIVKGLNAPEAITFLLAAPSINIITFIVTWEAFNFNRGMAFARLAATFIIANLTAYIVSRLIKPDQLLTSDFKVICQTGSHIHKSLNRTVQLFRKEMWLITRLLIIGALIAAVSQTFIPRDVITAIGSNIFLSVIAMLLLAFVISICSSVDAFFALAYIKNFSLGAILAFLVAGPMVDIKMIALMKTTFAYSTIAAITICVFMSSLIVGLLFSYVW